MLKLPFFRLCFFRLLLMLAGLQPAWGQLSVLTQHNDNGRSGANLLETVLTTSNVNSSHFGKLFSRSVNGQIYAQPLYVSNVSIPNRGAHNVVYVVTMQNNVYAFDADDPSLSTPLWQINLGTPVPYQDTGTIYTSMSPVIGITSTPVINLSTKTLYCVAMTKESGSYFQRLHALDLTSGQEKFGGPVAISGSVAGTGDGSVGGTLSFNPLKHLNRPALLLLNGQIYLAFGSHGDSSPYHGWIFRYDATTLQRQAMFCTTPTGGMGAIWQSGQGLSVDESGYIYLMTGNGSFNHSTGGPNMGMCFIKLRSPDLAVMDWFAPYDLDSLNGADLDLGSSGPLWIPGTNLIVGGGKEGVLHVLNRNNMGHFQAGSNSQIVQNFNVTNGNIHGSPVYWSGPNGTFIYVWGEQDYLKQYQYVNGLLQTTPFATSPMPVPNGMPGAMLSVSSRGNAAGTGIVWASHPFNGDANPATVAGIFRAFDASNVSTELWNSKQKAADDLGNFAKFCSPTVVNGKVYLATFSNQLVVYGLIGTSPPPPDTQAPSAPSNLVIASFTSTSVSLGWTASVDNIAVTGYRIFRGATQVGTSSATSFTDTGLNPNTTYTYTVKASDAAGNLSLPSNSVSATTSANITALPSPWVHQDIGSVGQAGSAGYASGTFTIRGSGTDIWDTADGFHYVYRSLNGDGQIVARVVSVQNTYQWAKAGVMIRETLSPGSTHALMAVCPAGTDFQTRQTTGSGIDTYTLGTPTAPYWVKLVRTGNTFNGYQSSNGVNWVLLGTDSIPMASNVYIGLAVTAHNNTVLCTATLDSVTMTGNTGQASTPPTVSLTSPANGATFTAPASITLTASASDSGGTVSKVDFYQGTTLLATDASAPYTFTWNNVAAGSYSLTAKATDNSGATTTSSAANITVSGSGITVSGSGGPVTWVDQDIGSVGLAGSASYSSGVFSVKGSGADIWNTADAFHYAYQLLAGDTQLIARVASEQNTDSWAKAGVMIRETLTAGSKNAMMAISPGSGSAFQCRVSSGGITTYSGGPATIPYWVKLVRTGNTLSAYQSPDGLNWTSLGKVSITMGKNAYGGLAVTAHNNTVLNTSSFTNVSVSSPWISQDVGSVGVAGSSSYDGTTFTLKGSGADIWGSTDAFRFMYQPLIGDGQIVARVASEQNTNSWAKAGVMIRETLSPGSTHALMAVCPAGTDFQSRQTTGAAIHNYTLGTPTAPYWVKLVRTGNTFNGYQSSDGVNWVLVGSDTITMVSKVYMGLAVTSHSNLVLNTSTFSNVNAP
jgi:hypothetical protein